MRVAYLEIYNEEVRDLLGKDQTARLEVSNCCCEFFLENIKMYLHFLSFLNRKMAQVIEIQLLKSLREDEGDPLILHHGCWWHGDIGARLSEPMVLS